MESKPMRSYARQVQAYEAIHVDRRNRALHAIGIPIILYSVLLAAAYLRAPGVGGKLAHAGSLLVVTTTIVLLVRSRSAACWYLALMVPLLLCASLTADVLSPGPGVLCAIAGFVVGWIVQFWGHALEGKAPQLMSSPMNTLIGPVMVTQDLAQRVGLSKSRSAAQHAGSRETTAL
jgi:uncharacterized membrane protein YGL010W